MSWVWAQLLGGLRLLADSANFYITAPLVLAVAAVPAVIRTHQLFSGIDNGWVELLVQTLRIALIAVMTVVGRTGVDATGGWWAVLWSDVVRTYRSGWPSIIVQLAVVTIVIVLFNAVVELLITTGSTLNALTAVGLDVLYAKQTALAATFAVKNFMVIPVYVISMLIASGAIRR